MQSALLSLSRRSNLCRFAPIVALSSTQGPHSATNAGLRSLAPAHNSQMPSKASATALLRSSATCPFSGLFRRSFFSRLIDSEPTFESVSMRSNRSIFSSPGSSFTPRYRRCCSLTTVGVLKLHFSACSKLLCSSAGSTSSSRQPSNSRCDCPF